MNLNWVLIRAAGLGAYLMLFLSVAWGLLATTSLVTSRISKRSSTLFHGFVAAAGLYLLGFHLAALLVDRFMRFELLDLLVPFRSTYRPFAVALGIASMYATVVVLASSWARKPLGTKRWRALHLLAVPAFAAALLHGVLAGSDSARPGITWMYWLTGATVLFLVIVRGLTARAPGARPQPQRSASRNARNLRSVSSTSSEGYESATIPAPANSVARSPRSSAHRSAIAHSPSPSASIQPTGPA
jgi:DMSO/TMAO reductase YedYZ heme-binding membrane subunit